MIFYRYLALTLTVFLICSCAPQQIRIDMLPIPLDGPQLPANKGVVLVRVADASPFIPLRLNYVTFAPKAAHADPKATYSRTESVNDYGVTSSTYFAVLPAGSYAIESLRSFHQFEQFSYSKFVPAGIQHGTFTVHAGEASNLGTIIFYPPYSGAHNYVKLLRSHSFSDDDARQLLAKHLPIFAATIPAHTPLHGWDADDLDDQRAVEYATAVQSTLAFNAALELPDNQLVFPSRLGTILFRDGEKRWHQDTLDSDVDILGYAKTKSGVQIIAGEYGKFCYREPGQKKYTDITPPSKLDPVVNIALAPDGKFFAVTANTKQLSIYSTDAIKTPQWKKIADVQLFSSDPLKRLIAPSLAHDIVKWHFLNARDSIYISVSDIFPDQGLYRFQFKENTLTEIKSPLGIFSDNFPVTISLQNDNLYVYHPGANDDFYKSADGGKSWVTLGGFLHPLHVVGVPQFWDSNRAFAVHKKSLPRNGKTVFNLLGSTDGGVTWSPLDNVTLPDDCNRLIPEIGAGNLLLHCPASSSFYLSKDAGLTWQEDRVVEPQ